MARISSIFDKLTVAKPAAMATVAERRYADAKALLDTKKNQHANGAVYLAGFVIEILLKARLVDKFPQLAKNDSSNIPLDQRGLWSLVWRQHDMEAILNHLEELRHALKKRGEREQKDHLRNLQKLCGEWRIHARYSPYTINVDEARKTLERVRSLKELLK